MIPNLAAYNFQPNLATRAGKGPERADSEGLSNMDSSK